MKSPSDVINLVFQAHPDAREKLSVLKTLLPIIDKGDIWKKTDDLINFFNASMIIHFQNEEALMAAVIKDASPTTDEKNMFSFIINEHHAMVESYKNLVSLAGEYKSGAQETREKFVETASDLIDQLLAHASVEDEKLYPALKKYVNTEIIKQINELIK